MAVTKSDLVEVLAQKANITKKKSESLLDTILDAMFETLLRQDRIEIRGFASWYVKNYKAYTGRNPKTGAAVDVNQKKLPFFKVGKELKQVVNQITGSHD
jgi:integration host factor subunit beta